MEGLKLIYFVLKPSSKDREHARASRAAMDTYADVIFSENPELAKEIREWVKSLTHGSGCHCGYC